MIKLENTDVCGWMSAIRGMRNPMNSWDKSDTDYEIKTDSSPNIGPNDLDLMKRLNKAGTDHAKFLRMINVTVDITAPLYWWAELDTYKIGTVRNSCSFMHKGVSKMFSIDDFSVKDERIYNILKPLPKKIINNYICPLPEGEFKYWYDSSGLAYKVYENGCVIREAYSYTDNWGKGRHRVIEEKICPESISDFGYIQLIMNRHDGKSWKHRVVAEAWIPNPENKPFVNHKDGNKQNNAVSNLEWVTSLENNFHAENTGLRENVKSLHRKYQSWKSQNKLISLDNKIKFWTDIKVFNLSYKELADKYHISDSQANNLRSSMLDNSNTELFILCKTYEDLIDTLNKLRELYLDTGDSQIFQQIRCLLPSGYLQKATWQANYAVLKNIYFARKNHKLDEWHSFCDWIETLPYFKEIILTEEN